MGDRLANLARAAQLIDEIPLTCVAGVSHAYDTEPAYGIATSVANCVVEIRTELHPLVLMDKLLEVENAMGRKRADAKTRDPKKPGTAARVIDCDLVWVEGETHQGAKLTLPHRRLGERDYVIVPMEDLMHDPTRFLTHGGVAVLPREQRVGAVTSDLGPIVWE